MQYAPSRGRYKVYLIDEVHMLSSHSFNALLKTLEEPPPHVKFLLATTDPQKLPVTILSRCLQFSLKNMPPERVVEHLTHVLGVENVPFEEDALWLLGRAADGSMRDAMSLTDQAIAFGEGKVLAADVRAMLGTLDHGQVYGVLQALLEGDARALLEAVRHLAEQGPDWAGVLAEMLNVLHRVAIAQALPEAVDNGQGDRDRVLALAQALDRLSLLWPDGKLTLPRVEQAVNDAAHFTPFHWVDALLAAKSKRALHILQQLRLEGSEPVILLRTLQRELLLLITLKRQSAHTPLRSLFDKHRVWQNRRAMTTEAINRLSHEQLRQAVQLLMRAELTLKQDYGQSVWAELESLSLLLCHKALADVFIDG